MDRVMVYGVTGSGKTTLAKQIAAKTGLPLIDVDEFTHAAGQKWVMVPDDEQRQIFTDFCAAERWVIDTAYGKWIDVPLDRTQLIIGLDYPRWLSLGRLIHRTISRAIDKKPICNGNIESWRQVLSRDSIIAWHFKSYKRKRARIHQWAAEGREVRVMRMPRDTQSWLDRIPAEW